MEKENKLSETQLKIFNSIFSYVDEYVSESGEFDWTLDYRFPELDGVDDVCFISLHASKESYLAKEYELLADFESFIYSRLGCDYLEDSLNSILFWCEV